MSETMCYADNFSRTFGEQQECLQFLREREENASWRSIPTREVRFEAIDEGSTSGKVLCDWYRLMGKEGILQDTMANTRLLLRAEDTLYPVRSCALSTILSRARISGHALSKVSKPVLAQILNHCVSVASGNALLRLSDEKVSAMHGGDESEYAVLEIPELFQAVTDQLEADFGRCRFISGHYEHAMMTAIWSFPNNRELVEAYEETAQKHGVSAGQFVPALRFSTSDVGISGANLYPMLMEEKSGRSITLGSALCLEHSNRASIADFKKQLSLLYPKYGDAIARLGKLMETGIDYPYNTMLRVMKRIGVTKRLAYRAAELWQAQNGERPCTAYDLYLGICEAEFLLQCDGASAPRVAQMEENISRALKVRWEDYDYAGEVKW